MVKEKKLFTAPRWNDPPVARVIGHEEISEEEFKRILQEAIDEFYGGKCPEEWLDAMK